MPKPNKYIENVSCPECGSSDAVGVYQREDSSYFGKCFKCDTIHNNIYEDKNERRDISKESIIDNTSSNSPSYYDGSFNSLKSRGIRKDICEKYEVRSILDAEGNDLVHFYPVIKDTGDLAVSVREVKNKKFSWINGGGKLKFFGQDIVGSNGKMIIITEGCADCLAAYQMLKEQGKSYRVVSVNNGADTLIKCAKDNYEWLMTFENIFLALDQDEPGQKRVEEFSNLFPVGKVKNVSFSEKDPNDLLIANKSYEFLQSLYKAKGVKAEGVLGISDILERILRPDPPCILYPWPKLNEVLLGYRRKELILIGASPGAGKSQFIKEIATNVISSIGSPVGLIFLEESPEHTAKSIASILANKKFILPRDKGHWIDEELSKELIKLEDKLYLFDHFGAKGFDEIKLKVNYMVRVLGAKDIFIDHITALVAAESDEYKGLNRLSEELASMAYDLDCTIFLVSHLRKSTSGKSFSEGAKISTDSFRGSGSLISWSHLVFALSRDQSHTDEQIRNTTTLSILKSRFIGEAVGFRMQLFYDKITGRMVEVDEEDFTGFDEDF